MSAQVDRISASAWLYNHPWMSKNKPYTLMTHVACESMLRSVVRSSMHPYPENWAEGRRVVVYYAQTACSFSAGII